MENIVTIQPTEKSLAQPIVLELATMYRKELLGQVTTASQVTVAAKPPKRGWNSYDLAD